MNLQQDILATLKYSSVFNYPLTEKEIFKYLISTKKTNLTKIKMGLKTLVENKKVYFFKKTYSLNPITTELYKSKKVSLRRYKQLKLQAKADLAPLTKLFFIKFIGITGSTAAKDLRGEFDVDLFFICQKNFMWVSRFLVVLFLKFKKMYKKPYCANIYTSNDFLNWGDKNIYIANEIARLKTLVNKDSTFERFLQKNIWVTRFLPNFGYYIPKCTYKKHNNFLLNLIFPVEFAFYSIEYLYMRPKISTEKISLKRIMFLKKDYKNKILESYMGSKLDH